MINLDKMNDLELIEYIREIKAKYAGKIAIPAHHYENSNLVNLADVVGDSYKLAVDCAKLEAEFVVFCGVRFMAEGSAVLARAGQRVIHPESSAGCPMADMISEDSARQAYDKISQLSPHKIAPVVYMNSYVDMKAFCGEHGGTVCTSSNAKKIVKHYLDLGYSVFFSPDHNLGINTARELGISDSEIVRVKQDLSLQGDPQTAKIFLWDGFCHVHVRFTTDDVQRLRQQYPGIKVIVHPESTEEVVKISDISGSTQKIFNEVTNSASDVKWAIGTEINFVERLAADNPEKTIVPLKVSLCHNMAKITLQNLAAAMASLDQYYQTQQQPANEVIVEKKYKQNAKKALQKMIEIVES
ncbi:MAG: quinolinate synthase NadA [Candidatus Cloacimonadales bacterium]